MFAYATRAPSSRSRQYESASVPESPAVANTVRRHAPARTRCRTMGFWKSRSSSSCATMFIVTFVPHGAAAAPSRVVNAAVNVKVADTTAAATRIARLLNAPTTITRPQVESVPRAPMRRLRREADGHVTVPPPRHFAANPPWLRAPYRRYTNPGVVTMDEFVRRDAQWACAQRTASGTSRRAESDQVDRIAPSGPRSTSLESILHPTARRRTRPLERSRPAAERCRSQRLLITGGHAGSVTAGNSRPSAVCIAKRSRLVVCVARFGTEVDIGSDDPIRRIAAAGDRGQPQWADPKPGVAAGQDRHRTQAEWHVGDRVRGRFHSHLRGDPRRRRRLLPASNRPPARRSPLHGGLRRTERESSLQHRPTSWAMALAAAKVKVVPLVLGEVRETVVTPPSASDVVDAGAAVGVA